MQPHLSSHTVAHVAGTATRYKCGKRFLRRVKFFLFPKRFLSRTHLFLCVCARAEVWSHLTAGMSGLATQNFCSFLANFLSEVNKNMNVNVAPASASWEELFFELKAWVIFLDECWVPNFRHNLFSKFTSFANLFNKINIWEGHFFSKP